MGEPLYLCQPPTGYSDAAEAWVSTGALVARLNFALQLAAGRLPGTRRICGACWSEDAADSRSRWTPSRARSSAEPLRGDPPTSGSGSGTDGARGSGSR
jgi:hypothetical protein